MKIFRVEEVTLRSAARVGGMRSEAFSIERKNGWKKVSNLAWVPSMRCLLLDPGGDDFLSNELVMVIPESNIIGMVLKEEVLLDSVTDDQKKKAGK